MTATWTVLGAGSILPRVDFGCAGYALRPAPGAGVTLFDCGPGSLRALARAGIALEEVRRVVISHLHVDHCLDLFALFFARRSPQLASLPPLELLGPVGLSAVLAGGRAAFGAMVSDPDLSLTEVPVAAGAVHDLDDLRLRCAPARHTPEALSWRVEVPGAGALVYTGDTEENAALISLARDAELLVAECSFADDRAVAGHLTPSAAARIARDADCRRLLLSHFYPQLDPADARGVAAQTFSGEIETARDGSVHILGA